MVAANEGAKRGREFAIESLEIEGEFIRSHRKAIGLFRAKPGQGRLDRTRLGDRLARVEPGGECDLAVGVLSGRTVSMNGRFFAGQGCIAE